MYIIKSYHLVSLNFARELLCQVAARRETRRHQVNCAAGMTASTSPALPITVRTCDDGSMVLIALMHEDEMSHLYLVAASGVVTLLFLRGS